MDEIKKFEQKRESLINANSENKNLQNAAEIFLTESADVDYSYNFSWLGRPIIQYPQDIVAIQEIIWEVKPDMIIETGIAHGGSLILSASILTLLEACGEIKDGKVLGVDIDIREHNKKAIEAHPMSKKITMFEGSSIDEEMIAKCMNFQNKVKE